MNEENIGEILESPSTLVDDAQITNDVEQNPALEEVNETEAQGTIDTSDDLPKGIKKRFATLTRQREEMRRELEELKSALASKNEKPIDISAMSDEEYSKYLVQKAIKEERDKQLQYESQRQLEAKKAEKIKSQVEQYSELVPDLKPVLAEVAELQMPQVAIDYIKDSDVGIMIAYQIGKNEEVYDKVIELIQEDRTGKKLERYLTKLELKLETDITSRKSESKNINKTKVVGDPMQKSTTKPSAAFDPSKLSMAEYRKWRAEQSKR